MQLLSARDMAQKTVIGKDRIVYSTDRDMMEQNYETDEWDRRFKELEKSDWNVKSGKWMRQFHSFLLQLQIMGLYESCTSLNLNIDLIQFCIWLLGTCDLLLLYAKLRSSSHIIRNTEFSQQRKNIHGRWS